MKRKIILVGDKFKEFANGKDILTVSQLKALVSIPSCCIDKEHEIIVGQGIDKDFAKTILDNQKNDDNFNKKIKLNSLENLLNKKSNSYTHKRLNHNTLIGNAEKIEDRGDSYRLPLQIDERCELMSDHQTGQHIQGMLLVEACRQTFIAITEEFIYEKQKNYYYVINSINTDFQSFLFPLPAEIIFTYSEKNINEHRGRFKAQMHVNQLGVTCATMNVSFSVYPSSIINEKENNLAIAATKNVIEFNNTTDAYYA
jgi:hypothetical protein